MSGVRLHHSSPSHQFLPADGELHFNEAQVSAQRFLEHGREGDLRAVMHSPELDMGNSKSNRRQRHQSKGKTERRLDEPRRGRPQGHTDSPLGQLILRAMSLLDLSYRHVISESSRLAALNSNADMRIGKSTLGDIISGKIRQPGIAKLDCLRIILHLSREEMDAAIGLQPERSLVEQLETTSDRTHEVSRDAVTRQRTVRIPILRPAGSLNRTQFLEGLVEGWAQVEVEYLSPFYPPHLIYVVVGETDNSASPVVPPGTRLLVNTLMTQVTPAENASYHQRELFYVLTPRGLTCSFLEEAPGEKIILVPHPLSGKVREEFKRSEVTVVGQVTGLLFRNRT